MMPTMGNLTLVVGVLSYDGQLNFTAAADRDGCPDVEEFSEGVRATLDELGRSADGAANPAQEGRIHVGSTQS
jgi:hypothetical protein